MKKFFFIVLFIAFNSGIIFFQLHNHVLIVRELYRKQRNEKIKREYREKKGLLIKELCMCKNPLQVKIFAQQQLHMQTVELRQIKAIEDHEK